MNSDHSRNLDLECMRLVSGCVDLGDELGAGLVYELLRLAGERSTEARRKLELECLRMAAECMQLAGDVQNFNLQRRFLELARRLTAVAEATPPRLCQATI